MKAYVTGDCRTTNVPVSYTHLKVGMTREEIITSTKIPNSGDLTTKLEELESCGFIRKYNAFGMKKKNAIYQLSLIHIFDMAKREAEGSHIMLGAQNVDLNLSGAFTGETLSLIHICLRPDWRSKLCAGRCGVYGGRVHSVAAR